MTRKPLPLALVGCGAVSDLLYVPALSELEREGCVQAVAVVDPNRQRATSVRRTLQDARAFGALDEMLADIVPQLAVIAAPHQFHVDLTLNCFDDGIHVLCEKPMALSTVESDRMTQAAERAGRLLAVGHFRRFFPSCQIVKQLLDAQLLGRVRSFTFLEGETYSWPAQSGSFFRRAEAGGGVLIDAGAHTMDLLVWWLGDPVEVEYEDDAMGGVEANCRIRLSMANGAVGTVQLSRDWPLPNRYVIECEKGWIAYNCDVTDRIEWGLHDCGYGLNAEIREMAKSTSLGMNHLDPGASGFMDCFVAQLRNVIAAIEGRESLRVSGSEARKSVALIERCYQSRRLLPMPWLSESEITRAADLSHA